MTIVPKKNALGIAAVSIGGFVWMLYYAVLSGPESVLWFGGIVGVIIGTLGLLFLNTKIQMSRVRNVMLAEMSAQDISALKGKAYYVRHEYFHNYVGGILIAPNELLHIKPGLIRFIFHRSVSMSLTRRSIEVYTSGDLKMTLARSMPRVIILDKDSKKSLSFGLHQLSSTTSDIFLGKKFVYGDKRLSITSRWRIT